MMREFQFGLYCGLERGELETSSIDAGSIRSSNDDDWALFTVTGSPRRWHWERLARLIGELPDACPAVISFDCGGGDLHGLNRLDRAIRKAVDRDCVVFAFTERRTLGGAFVASCLCGLQWVHPLARVGGLGPNGRPADEAFSLVKMFLSRDVSPSERTLERLAAGAAFNGEEAELLLQLVVVRTELESCLPPIGSGFQKGLIDD